MKINDLEGLTDEHVINELRRGARFVIYQYCISLLIVTFKRPSKIYFIRPEESAVTKGLGFSALSPPKTGVDLRGVFAGVLFVSGLLSKFY